MLDLSVRTYGKSAVATMPSPAQPSVPPVKMPSPPPPPVAPVSMPAVSAATDLLDACDDWDWKQLRNYVMRKITERHGPQPPGDEIRISSIFQSFHKRWGGKAGAIARFAFEQQDGYWRSAPVTAIRFTKGADPYFAQPIADRLT